MGCDLTLQGQIVVGGQGCGCSQGSATKVQPLGLSCAASYAAIESSDCPKTINSLTEFVPLLAMASVGLLFVQTSNAMELEWDGDIAVLQGSQVLGGVVFAGGEQFTFEVTDANGAVVEVETTFVAATKSLAQVRDILNGSAIIAGAGYMPVSLSDDGTRLIITAARKGSADYVDITVPLLAIGFGDLVQVFGLSPQGVSVKGSFLAQFDPPITDLKIKGSGQVTYLAGGA